MQVQMLNLENNQQMQRNKNIYIILRYLQLQFNQQIRKNNKLKARFNNFKMKWMQKINYKIMIRIFYLGIKN